LIFVVDDDFLMAEVLARAVGGKTRIFQNGVEVMAAIAEGLPEVIILDILLVGPTGFSLLNELQSYEDTAKIPVIVVSSVAEMMDLEDLREYGVVAVFDKATMLPEDLREEVGKWITKG
jgi:CheY-like chemotaxis protein